MNFAVFDCPLGIAGDMTVGAFLDAGMPFKLLKQELKKLHLRHYRISVKNTKAGAFRAKKFCVKVRQSEIRHHTSLKAIEGLIRKSKLHSRIKRTATLIFRKLGRVEARMHGIPLQKVHFHEVGAVDSIIDIVGAAICLHHLKIKKGFVRNLTIGKGVHGGSHGTMPVPAPAAYELLKGFSIRQSENFKEMITPTGAAILSVICEKNKKIPRVKINSIGYGAGDRHFRGTRGFVRVALASNVRGGFR